jgi:hypothetical protein
MSIFWPDPITCDDCGHVNQVETPRSVNGQRAPQHRKAVLDGTFQVFVCEKCAVPFRIEPGFFYIDLSRRQWFGVFPPSHEPEWARWEEATYLSMHRGVGASAPPIAQQWQDGLMTRVVFGVAALREKLVAHDAGIDDRVLELAKLDLVRSGAVELDATARTRLVAADAECLQLIAGDDVIEIPRARLEAMELKPWRALWNELADAIFVDVARLLLPAVAVA